MRSSRRIIPSFSLYGEAAAAPGQSGLHIETIQSRSRKYLWKIGTHRHTSFSQCVFVTAGPVTVALDEIHADLAGSCVMIIPAGTVHSFRFRAETQGFVLTADLGRLLRMATAPYQAPIEALFSLPRAVDLRSDPPFASRVERLLERLWHEFRQPESLAAPVGGWLACSALWILALGITAATPELHSSHDVDRLRHFRLLLESQYLRHWPVRRYAKQLALSETSLNRLCRRLTGSTAFDLIQQRVALEARRRLVYAAGSVGDIAAELGFKDAAYFCRFFRRRCGHSPNEFRRRQAGG